MYHGTDEESARSIMRNGFRQSNESCMLGRGVYCSRDIDEARKYGSVILVLDVDVGKVKKLGSQSEINQYRKSWHAMGYDSAWVPPGVNPSGQEEDCVWDPSRLTVVSTHGMASSQPSFSRSSGGSTPIRNYQRTLLHRELLKKINKCPPTSVHIPELRRVSFYADDDFLEKPPWSSVATYDTRSYADSDPYIGILEIKSRAQVEAEERQAWADLKAKSSSKAWKPKAR